METVLVWAAELAVYSEIDPLEELDSIRPYIVTTHIETNKTHLSLRKGHVDANTKTNKKKRLGFSITERI